MAEEFDFHYVPSPTGEISGKSVLKQTEDAINDIGRYAKGAYDSSTNAEAISNQALEVARQAQSTASNAEAAANNAVEKVDTLNVVVSGYDQKITTAVTIAESAQQSASSAQSSAQASAGSAQEAKVAAENASESAADAAAQAGNAVTTAQSASEAAQTAQENAASAAQSASEAAASALSASESASNALNRVYEAVNEAYAFRVYTAGNLTANSTFDESLLTPQGNVKVGDTVIDQGGLVFQITAEDENEEGTGGTVTVGDVINNLNNFVSYGRAQTLTDDQQDQVLSNIGLTSIFENIITTNGGTLPTA